MPAVSSAEELIACVRQSGLLEPQRLEEYLRRTNGSLPDTPRPLAQALMRDGLVTRYQAEQLLMGRWRNFTIGGKYRVLERLGYGGSASVFLCEHLAMRRLVALKVLPTANANDPDLLARFYREARAVAQLNHPNIVAAFDVDQADKLHFLVTEFVDGPSLDHLVSRRGRLGVADACQYISQAARGLQHAHEAGLVHRDIKPHNLLVDRTGTLKILDMGLALMFHEDAGSLTMGKDFRMLLGTIDYLPPEQAVDSHAVDIRADIYSLGATLYHILASHAMFPEGTVRQKLTWHQMRKPKPLNEVREDVSVGLAKVVARMLEKEPEARYQTPAEVEEALAKWAIGTISPPTEEEMPRLSPAAQRVVSSTTTMIRRTPATSTSSLRVVTRGDQAWWLRAVPASRRPAASAAAARLRGWVRRQPRWVPTAAAAAASLLILAGGWTVLMGASRNAPGGTALAEVRPAASPPNVEASAASSAPRRPAPKAIEPKAAVAVSGPAANSIGMKFASVPAGEFLMGASDSDKDAGAGERPQKKVRVAKPFEMGATEVTVAQFRAFVEATGYETDAEASGLGGLVWDGAKGGFRRDPKITWHRPLGGEESTDEQPVTQVTWADAVKFCEWLSKKEGIAYRLPTEEQWEYACRAGTTTRWFSGDDPSSLDQYAWYPANFAGMIHPVGQKKPNPFGLYDMHGNVSEWCRDGSKGDSVDPADKSGHFTRGGSCEYNVPATRSTARTYQEHDASHFTLGFRVVREVAAGNTIGMRFGAVPAGEFLMGAPDSDKDANAGERPQRKVRITKPFEMGATEVTVAQFRAFVEASGYETDAETSGLGGQVWDDAAKANRRDPKANWRRPKGAELAKDDEPVCQVTWNDAVEFCRWLSKKEGVTYRLPTAQEWEYACRGGTSTLWFFGDDPAQLGEFAWFDSNSGYTVHPVGTKKPNPFGLYDVYGNVTEWCRSETGGPDRPVSARGGRCDLPTSYLRTSHHEDYPADHCYMTSGFRVCREPR
jgi:formylglycine-generating enzyme required for sulfatase activity/serine/threonine protein kinase